MIFWKNLFIESGKGLALCMEKALAQCGVAREDINYVNANAVSSPADDLKEYLAITHCFGKNPRVSWNVEFTYFWSWDIGKKKAHIWLVCNLNHKVLTLQIIRFDLQFIPELID